MKHADVVENIRSQIPIFFAHSSFFLSLCQEKGNRAVKGIKTRLLMGFQRGEGRKIFSDVSKQRIFLNVSLKASIRGNSGPGDEWH